MMPSDQHNSIMAMATGLIFSLFDVASAREVSFGIPQCVQCILQGLTNVLLCVPFIFADSERHRVSNVKNRHLQNNLLTAFICWTNSHLNTAAVMVNSIALLGWKWIKICENHDTTSCNSQK